MKMGLDDLEWQNVYTVGFVINIISIVCSVFVLLTLIVLALHNHRNVNRISLRLQAAIALVDVLNHVNNILHWTLPDGPACVFNGFFRFFGRQLFCFFYVAIALNLQLIFLHGFHPNSKWEIFYWAVPITVALIMNIPPLVLGMFGHDGGRCLLKEDTGYNNRLLVTANLTLVMLFTFLYCSIAAILVMLKLRSNLKVVRSLAPHRHIPRLQDKHTMEQNIRRLIFRISLYPLACVASLASFFIVNIMYLFNQQDPTMTSIALINQSFSGIFNIIAFLLDPTFHRAIGTFWNDIKESRNPNSSNKAKLQALELNDVSSELGILPPRIDTANNHDNHNLHLL